MTTTYSNLQAGHYYYRPHNRGSRRLYYFESITPVGRHGKVKVVRWTSKGAKAQNHDWVRTEETYVGSDPCLWAKLMKTIPTFQCPNAVPSAIVGLRPARSQRPAAPMPIPANPDVSTDAPSDNTCDGDDGQDGQNDDNDVVFDNAAQLSDRDMDLVQSFINRLTQS